MHNESGKEKAPIKPYLSAGFTGAIIE